MLLGGWRGSRGGCAPAAAALPVAGVPWLDGETGTYAWLEGGAEVGTAVFSQRRVAEVWELRNTTVLGRRRANALSFSGCPRGAMPITTSYWR